MKTLNLSLTQLRILRALLPTGEHVLPHRWPTMTKTTIRSRAGFSEKNTLNRPINGGSGDEKRRDLGLVEMGLVECIPLDIDGLVEVNYRITSEGIECLHQFDAETDRSRE